MQRTVNLAKNCFKPSNPLFVRSGSINITSTIVARPMSSLSRKTVRNNIEESSFLFHNRENNTLKAKSSLPTEDEVRRYVVGLSKMSQGKLRPATSFEQVILYFHNQTDCKVEAVNKVKEVLQRKTHLIESSSGNTVVEWKYGF